MRCMDGFVFASEREGFPNVIIEAMATGLPVIAQDIPGILSYIIRSPETGVLVQPGDNAEIANWVLNFAKKPELGKIIGKKARQEVIQKFSLETEVMAHAKLYKDIFV